jgi:hypothetical protein
MRLWEEARSKGIHYLREGSYAFILKIGAYLSVYASPYTQQFNCSQGAFQYSTGEDRFDAKESVAHWATHTGTMESIIPDDIDIVMTHGPPKYILDQCGPNGTSSGGCEHLWRAICKTRPLLHCFGHIHSGYGAQRAAWESSKKSFCADEEIETDGILTFPVEYVGQNQARKRGYASLSPSSAEAFACGDETLFVNCAIMNAIREPTNAPWVVTLSLPCKGRERFEKT